MALSCFHCWAPPNTAAGAPSPPPRGKQLPRRCGTTPVPTARTTAAARTTSEGSEPMSDLLHNVLAAILFASVLLIAACGLVYELVAGALASYLLGDSVTQFSTVIGTYLCAMGVGSWLSRHL